jgi:hypothetical protein
MSNRQKSKKSKKEYFVLRGMNRLWPDSNYWSARRFGTRKEAEDFMRSQTSAVTSATIFMTPDGGATIKEVYSQKKVR